MFYYLKDFAPMPDSFGGFASTDLWHKPREIENLRIYVNINFDFGDFLWRISRLASPRQDLLCVVDF